MNNNARKWIKDVFTVIYLFPVNEFFIGIVLDQSSLDD